MQTSKASLRLITVTGPIEASEAKITDGHNHVWIKPVPSGDPSVPILNDKWGIAEELIDYREVGGGTIVDCQPGGCGRDGLVMRELSASSGVNIVACTGYHLERYYPSDYWLFRSSMEVAHQYFSSELLEGLRESRGTSSPILAGFIKIACEKTLEKSPLHLMEAAVLSSLKTGAAIEAHTEGGADAERIAKAFFDLGLPPNRLILCHMDKRADFELHKTLAGEGIFLEYDTFYRPKYQPEKNLWPLLECMVAANLASQLILATDMAEAKLWKRLGGSPGLTDFVKTVIPRLESLGFDASTIKKLVSENIAACLARPHP